MMISSSPKLFIFLLCASFLFLCSLQPIAAAKGNETDMQSLLAFKNGITSDPFGVLNSWNHSIHFCQWFGVTCGHRHPERVTSLVLENQNLKGSISPHIGNLSFLRELWLGNNTLGQGIPPEIGRLQRLKMFSLRNNSIDGDIPANISRCSNLVDLELTRNNLEGKIPAEIGMLSKLERLYMSENFKILGVIPSNLGNLSSLNVFYAVDNIISGSIPEQLGRLQKLEYFGVDANKLVGTIPPLFWNISSMKAVGASMNQIEGTLPLGLGGIIFPLLSYFNIYSNLFTGTIPDAISNASYLEELDLSENKMIGGVPPMNNLKNLRRLLLLNNSLGTAGKVDDFSFLSSLKNATNLKTVSLSFNDFGGELPNSIGNLSSGSLNYIDLGYCKVSGSIPHEVGNLVSLMGLRFEGNKLTGSIPSSIGNLNKLQGLSVSDSNLGGTIPPSFGNLSNLLYLYMDGNNFHGMIPSSLGKCTELLELLISSNNLQGNIPSEVFSASSLYILNLDGNRLTGFLPTEIGTLINLIELDISDNMLSGKLPNSLATCVQLTKLDMGVNKFSGILPSSLSSLRGLEKFNISRNNFSGTIPTYLEEFPFLHSIDLSFNDFEGEVPDSGIFKNTTAFNIGGNIKLCGGLLELGLPSCSFNPPEKKLRAKLIIGLAFVAIGAVLFLIFLYLCLCKKSSALPPLRVPWNSLLKLSYQNLYEATNGFSDANIIGVGSFGVVYKGLLHQGQQMVAVKVLSLQHQGASRSFQAECEALRRIRHRNLLKVLTACSSIDHQGNEFKALIYEFMPKGSLDGWLHLHEIQGDIQGDARNLDLCQRLDILLDVASAVEYLHHRSEDPIVHCDLKPSNILLDNDMVAHVGDFGLAKFLEDGTTNTNQSSGVSSITVGLRGSVGYVAPEYGMGNEVSTSGDVYSFGIIVLEMFTGKRPTDHHLFNGCLNLVDYVEMALPEKVEVVADSRLLIDENGDTTRSDIKNQGSTPSCVKIKKCLLLLFKVGIACAQELPKDRMQINDAIIQLHAIKKALLRNGDLLL